MNIRDWLQIYNILTGGDTVFLAKRLKNTIFANSNFLLESLNQTFNIKSTMIKTFIAACLFLSVVSFAQQGTSSPYYSYYGIGDVRYKVLKCVRWQGAVEQDSIHLNMDNLPVT
jgi:hypothetical protein